MDIDPNIVSPSDVVDSIVKEIARLGVKNTSTVRAIRKAYSKRLKAVEVPYIMAVAFQLVENTPYRWVGYELITSHKPAFESLDETSIEALGKGINSWDTVDSFGRSIAGPAWLRGQIPDDVIYRWAGSDDFWWRRAALVSTVALNMRSHGGYGDTSRTLAVCEMLVDDHEDMIVKAMSWALRELVVHDPQAVRAFLEKHNECLTARVKREVTNKLETGLKKPRQEKNDWTHYD